MSIKNKKISFVLVLMLVLSFTLTACGGDSNDSGNGEPATDSDKEIVIKFSHNQPVTSPEHAGAEKFKEIAEEKGNGNIKVEIYPAGQMGSLREQVEGTQIGTIDISLQPSAVISPFVDDIKVCDLPYLWPSDREVTYEVLDGEMGRELLDRLETGGFHGLGYWFGGYKLFTTQDKEIHSPSDFEGVKMRVMEAPILLSQYKAWGGNPISLPYAELYNGLQQGIVDGQENPLQTIYLNNFHEVQNQIIESYHGAMMYITISNKTWFEGLSDEVKDIVMEAEEAGREEAREVLLETENEYVENIKATGVNYYELTPEEIEEFSKASRPVHEEHYNTEWQKDYINRLYEALNEAAK
jgi:C4-dicarboxylate-binding protein DctP